MKPAIRVLLGLMITLGAVNAHAQRIFNQAELDSLLAPIALYPDPLLTHVLNASLYPDDVAAAAAWSRANPQLQGDAALATVESTSWHPSVKALIAYPDVLSRMVESPQWLTDLGEAYTGSSAYVNATIQQLRARAQASGYLRSNEQQYVYQQGPTIVVQPVYPNVVYAPYYDPYVVYGTWWWPAYRPFCWRPFVAQPIIVTRIVQPVRIVQPARLIQNPVRLAQPVQVTPFHNLPESQRMPIIRSAPPVAQPAQVTPFRPVPEPRRMPIMHSGPAFVPPMRAAPPAQIIAPWHGAPVAQSAPIARSMPAPQLRATERSFSHGFQAAGGGSRGGGGGNVGNRGGGGHHRS